MRDISLPELPRLLLIRGLPGAGKTRLAQDYVAQGYLYLEADQFFMESSQYRFDQEKQGEAHAWCLDQTRKAIEGGGHVCVANVFATIPDVWPYTMLGVEYQVVEAGFPERSVLDVPAELILDLQRRWVPTEQMIEALRISASPKRVSEDSAGNEFPDLTFDLEYSKAHIPRDMRRFLYKGGAATRALDVYQKIDVGELGEPLKERVELVRNMHEVLANALGMGKSRRTLDSWIDVLKVFFTWADETNTRLDMDSVEISYLDWTEALLHRAQIDPSFSKRGAWQYGSLVGRVLDQVFDRCFAILKTTRLPTSRNSSPTKHSKADKQDLGEVEMFGHLLIDIIDGLSLDAIWGAIPVKIPLRNGLVLEEWSWLKRPETIKPSNSAWPRQSKYAAKQAAKNRSAWSANLSFGTRFPLINLRILAEMLVFISQTGMNLAQAHKLKVDRFSFKASTHGYDVRSYKHRRGGEVQFEIYQAYRRVFEDYLLWRKGMFPNDTNGLLFPMLKYGRLDDTAPKFNRIKTLCGRAGVKYFPPSHLRKTKANFLARRFGDPKPAAEAMQHSVETFHRNYEEPNLQRTMVQVANFWAANDPALAAAGPGSCAGKAPKPIVDIPPTATRPDCIVAAGCLFCENQRDIDSQDHVWSLATYRVLKSFELTAHYQPESNRDVPKHPAELVIERLTAKLAYIKASSEQRRAWVEEALVRIEEGRYHPDWEALIDDGHLGVINED